MKIRSNEYKKIGPMDGICATFLKHYAHKRGYIVISHVPLDKATYFVFEMACHDVSKEEFEASPYEEITMLDIFDTLLSTYFKG